MASKQVTDQLLWAHNCNQSVPRAMSVDIPINLLIFGLPLGRGDRHTAGLGGMEGDAGWSNQVAHPW